MGQGWGYKSGKETVGECERGKVLAKKRQSGELERLEGSEHC